mgnify:CR=1 FL=1
MGSIDHYCRLESFLQLGRFSIRDLVLIQSLRRKRMDKCWKQFCEDDFWHSVQISTVSKLELWQFRCSERLLGRSTWCLQRFPVRIQSNTQVLRAPTNHFWVRFSRRRQDWRTRWIWRTRCPGLSSYFY